MRGEGELKSLLQRLETVDFLIEQRNSPSARGINTSPGWARMGKGRVWDLSARRIFSALRLKILMPGAKSRRQALRSHTPALSHPGEGVISSRVRLHCRVRKSMVSFSG